MIRRVSRDFVPVALPLYKIRKANGEAGRFYWLVQKQRPKQYQGIYIVSPEGKVLANQSGQPDKGKSWTEDLLERIDQGLKIFGPVAPRRVGPTDPLPYRGVGVRPDGSVSAAVYCRYMFFGLRREGLSGVVPDSATLSAGDWARLGPPQAEPGSRWVVPEAVVRQFNRVLAPGDGLQSLARPEEVTSARLTGTVESVAGGVAYLTYEGHLAGVHAYEYKPHKGKKVRAQADLTGVGAWDVKTGRLLSLTLVAEGVFHPVPPWDEAKPYGAVVEWRRQR